MTVPVEPERGLDRAVLRGSRGGGIRMAGESGGTRTTSSVIHAQLQRRLRLIMLMWGLATGAIAVLAIFARWSKLLSRPLTLFTEPPLPGALLLVAFGAMAIVGVLSSKRTLPAPRLRLIEWSGVAITVGFFLLNQLRGLSAMLPGLAGKPMEIGVAQGAPWGIAIVAYGVLVPSSLRHGVIRTAVIAACAFIPDLILLPATIGPIHEPSSYLTIKALVIAVMSALAIYGAYRIEELGEDAQIARELGQYVLRRMLGEGSMGSVYLADHRFLLRPCAVKLIRPEQSSDTVALARFEREVQSAAALTHPNTVQIYDYGQSEDGTFYFAMEYLPGSSLEDYVSRHGPLEATRAVRILVQLCGALYEAHLRGLVHRDVKPGNVMLCDRGGLTDVAKLLDFGLVAPVQEQGSDPRITQTGMIMGTPAYMSPEQCAGVEALTPTSDLYSLGALGYFLLSGRPPFGGRSVMQTIIAHLNEAPIPLTSIAKHIPPALSNVITRCLEKDPDDRFESASALAQALNEAISGTGGMGELSQAIWTPRPDSITS